MKKILPIIVIVVVLVIVVVSGVLMIKKNSQLTYTPPQLTYTNEPVSNNMKEETAYAYSNNIQYTSSSLDNSFEDVEAFKTINGQTYKNINSIPSNSLDLYNYNKYGYGDLIDYTHDKDDERLFDEDKLIFPKALFLVNSDINAFYNYNGEFYFIPVIKCNSEDEERILFRDFDLTIGKKDGSIYVNGNKLGILYNSTSLDFNGLFNSYFILNPELSNIQINLYKTNIDSDNSTTELRLTTASNLDSKLESMCNTFIVIKNDAEYDLCVAPMDLGKHTNNYSNLFYKEANYIHINESGESINQDTNKKLYLFDNGFKVIVEE